MLRHSDPIIKFLLEDMLRCFHRRYEALLLVLALPGPLGGRGRAFYRQLGTHQMPEDSALKLVCLIDLLLVMRVVRMLRGGQLGQLVCYVVEQHWRGCKDRGWYLASLLIELVSFDLPHFEVAWPGC